LTSIRFGRLFLPVLRCRQADPSLFGSSRKFQARWRARKVSGMSSTAEGFTYEWESKQYLARVNVPSSFGAVIVKRENTFHRGRVVLLVGIMKQRRRPNHVIIVLGRRRASCRTPTVQKLTKATKTNTIRLDLQFLGTALSTQVGRQKFQNLLHGGNLRL
jgi:hypothetical protein